MYNVIVIFIIFIVITKIINKNNRKRWNSGGKSYTGNGAQKEIADAFNKQISKTSQPYNPGTPLKTESAQKAVTAQKAVAAQKAVQGKKAMVSAEKEKSMTQQLQEKADKGAYREEQEKRKQEVEERRNYGQIRYADRYILGDSIPKEKKMKYCAYCGAENLVPIQGSGKYNCYFCRGTL